MVVIIVIIDIVIVGKEGILNFVVNKSSWFFGLLVSFSFVRKIY